MTLLINIDVPDVGAGVAFYTAAFGLTVGRRFGTDFVELLGWPAPLYLLTKAPGTPGAGAALEAAARDAPYGRIAMLADPFGHGFCLVQFNQRGYDALLDD
ncbi:MAG: VOC family protein [Reyranella sp.]|nr:VOC family protein [Reyranella sp.]